MLNLHRFDSDVLKNENEEFRTVQHFTKMPLLFIS